MSSAPSPAPTSGAPSGPSAGAPSASSEEDRALVRRALGEDGRPPDQAAFARLVGKYQGPLTRHVGQMMRTDADVEDLVQEALVKAFGALRPLLARVRLLDVALPHRDQPRHRPHPAAAAADGLHRPADPDGRRRGAGRDPGLDVPSGPRHRREPARGHLARGRRGAAREVPPRDRDAAPRRDVATRRSPRRSACRSGPSRRTFSARARSSTAPSRTATATWNEARPCLRARNLPRRPVVASRPDFCRDAPSRRPARRRARPRGLRRAGRRASGRAGAGRGEAARGRLRGRSPPRRHTR